LDRWKDGPSGRVRDFGAACIGSIGSSTKIGLSKVEIVSVDDGCFSKSVRGQGGYDVKLSVFDLKVRETNRSQSDVSTFSA